MSDTAIHPIAPVRTPDSPDHPPTAAEVFRGFDGAVERTIGADMRLIYGMAVPILMICGLIIVLAMSPATWLVGLILVLEVAGVGVVLTGLFAMLNEPADDA